MQADKTYYCRVKILGEGVYTDSAFGIGEGKTSPMPAPGSEVLLYKDFDDFWWGGYSIAAAFGICPSSAAQKLPATMNIAGSVFADDDTTVVGEPSKNADDTFATVGKNNADYLAAAGATATGTRPTARKSTKSAATSSSEPDRPPEVSYSRT